MARSRRRRTRLAPIDPALRVQSAANSGRYLQLCALFIRQDLRTRFAGNLLGLAWAVLAPLLTLAVFNLVFVHILRARVPGLEGGTYLVFLALGFWPWFAFSEALARATTALTEQAALAEKIALPRSVGVLAAVLTPFGIHGFGFGLVLLVLAVAGPALDWSALPFALLMWLPLLAMAWGLGLLLASLQVFVRDLAQTVSLLVTLWFFLTPILYAPELVSPRLAAWLAWNPMSGVIDAQRALLPGLSPLPGAGWGTLVGLILLPTLGLLVYRRLRRHLEEFA